MAAARTPSPLGRLRFGSGTVGRFAAEVLAIFVGITMSFGFDEWRAERAERAQEERYLRGLQVELQGKYKELLADADTSERKTLRTEISAFISAIEKEPATRLPATQLRELTTQCDRDQLVTLNFNTPTITALGTSGEWLILDDSVRAHVSALLAWGPLLEKTYAHLNTKAAALQNALYLERAAQRKSGEKQGYLLAPETQAVLGAYNRANLVFLYVLTVNLTEPYARADSSIKARLRALD